jgi:hypothetical protein
LVAEAKVDIKIPLITTPTERRQQVAEGLDQTLLAYTMAAAAADIQASLPDLLVMVLH